MKIISYGLGVDTISVVKTISILTNEAKLPTTKLEMKKLYYMLIPSHDFAEVNFHIFSFHSTSCKTFRFQSLSPLLCEYSFLPRLDQLILYHRHACAKRLHPKYA